MVTRTDNFTINAGYVIGPKGDTGPQGPAGTNGTSAKVPTISTSAPTGGSNGDIWYQTYAN